LTPARTGSNKLQTFLPLVTPFEEDEGHLKSFLEMDEDI